MIWSCSNCGSEVDDELEMCWKCGTSRDGSPAPSEWRSELAPVEAPQPLALSCLRCSADMVYVGKKRFHEGSYAADVLLGDLFVNREELDLYMCSGCGKVEFFATRQAP